MESRLRKLELAGFSSALIGNVCPKQGFRKVTSTVSASSSIGVRRAALCLWSPPPPLGQPGEDCGVPLDSPSRKFSV